MVGVRDDSRVWCASGMTAEYGGRSGWRTLTLAEGVALCAFSHSAVIPAERRRRESRDPCIPATPANTPSHIRTTGVYGSRLGSLRSPSGMTAEYGARPG